MFSPGREIWFWQRMITPHVAGLATAMAERGARVTYIANERMSSHRASQGWSPPVLGKVRLELLSTSAQVKAAVFSAPEDSVHICQGLSGNGLVGVAQQFLRYRSLPQWIMMEAVDDSGWLGCIKRLAYRVLLQEGCRSLEGILAIGEQTASWLQRRGFPAERIFPFAYFLSVPDKGFSAFCGKTIMQRQTFRVLFVGQLIRRKRIDHLMETLAGLKHPHIELWVVGAGPLESALKKRGDRILPGRVGWLGRQPIRAVPSIMAEADCLVLPSWHDGWGSVVAEALMVGTPVICSSACGASEVVRASRTGGVFRVGDRQDLSAQLAERVRLGPWPLVQRRLLARWACCLNAGAGASYLEQILAHKAGECHRPYPPWTKATD